ncbi:hypothetical protein DVH24_013421 [Malus domestica]|uniref:Uncharacterized protein n=1 Tax=Malus domestica TaxID=3750 RepID=A0A498HMB2_MALDO|nr:hypothetical protein DVH24_013421 [Malus domestica]
MSGYTTSTIKSDHENKVISNFDFNVANLVARELAFFKTRIADIEKEKRHFKVSKELKMKKNKKAYEEGVKLFWAYANLHSGAKANKDGLDVDVTDKRNLIRRRLF